MKSIVVQMAQMRVSTACSERIGMNEMTLMRSGSIFGPVQTVWQIVSVLLSEPVRLLVLWMGLRIELLGLLEVRTSIVIVLRFSNWILPGCCVPMPGQ